ncbi:GerAB/ArcD/ProY family transporter [Cohnella faecalis]|uniref:Spore gernimation protein KB n=1 Tax=Cohnella faecalis TaxID=2315694 RepID=A0A398D2H7_9BACL|nr:GerAB/ArcD/ProY family transporter [Cohnella faecalis]RIE05274.1 spore gernimation protein KB [Cohnella faecalis]
MEKAKLGVSQLFALICLFEFGSAIVVGLGMQAKQDAWLAILIGMIGGMALFAVYNSLFRLHPEIPLTGYIPKIVGVWIGYPLSVAYILYFMYIAARVLRDLGALLLTSKLDRTPMSVINLMIILIVIYAIVLGIETLGRAGEFFLAVMILCLVAGAVSAFASGIIHPENLAPVLENGWKLVLTTAFPLTLTFPFGEMIVFTMLLPYLNQPARSAKTGMTALLSCGLILGFIRAVDISVLGLQKAGTSLFPLLETLSKVNIGNVIQRLDAIVIMILVIGGFFKIAVFTYAAALGISHTFKLRNRSLLAIFVGLAVWVASLFIARNVLEHLETGLSIVPFYLHLPLQAGIPVLLLVLAWIRTKMGMR